MLAKFKRYHHKRDALAYLIGKVLVKEALQTMGMNFFNLVDLQYSPTNRPGVISADPIDFNISHSGNYVLCAYSDEVRVGVDIEEINSIPLDDYCSSFLPREWKYINNSHDKCRTFFECWTKKEASLKAEGSGLQIPLNELNTLSNPILIGEAFWYNYSLSIDKKYSSHLSISEPLNKRIIETRQFPF